MCPPISSSPTAEPQRRQPLTRRRVLRAALECIDRDGLGKLTMRLVATQLGVEAASLYRHVASKEDLEAGVAELMWEEIAAAAPADASWPSWLRSLGHAIRDVIHRHPGTLGLWATQPILPVPALELFDAQLAYCEPGTRAEGARILQVVCSFALGFAGSELSWFSAPGTQPPGTQAQQISRIARTLPPSAPDRLVDVALLVCTGDTGPVFDTGLDLMIRGLALPATSPA